MFPQGSARIAEAMYSQGLHAQALHEAMAEAIAAIVERQPQRRWRLLELGAGTAAASRTVIARLAPLVQRGRRWTTCSPTFPATSSPPPASASPTSRGYASAAST